MSALTLGRQAWCHLLPSRLQKQPLHALRKWEQALALVVVVEILAHGVAHPIRPANFLGDALARAAGVVVSHHKAAGRLWATFFMFPAEKHTCSVYGRLMAHAMACRIDSAVA